MQKPWLAIFLMAAVILGRPGNALPADQERSRQNPQAQQNEPIYGSELMSEQERVEHRARMRSARSAEEQEQIRREHHEKMKSRAEERGLTIPKEVPLRGRGMGPRACCFPPSYGSSIRTEQQLAKAEIAMQGPENPQGIPYMSGGIGEDDPVLQTSQNYNLHMVFATKGTGEYVADIKVVIEDTKGKKILEAESPGPIFYVKLPSGNYRVTAGYQGNSLSKLVTVKEQSFRDLYFHWPSDEIPTNQVGS